MPMVLALLSPHGQVMYSIDKRKRRNALCQFLTTLLALYAQREHLQRSTKKSLMTDTDIQDFLTSRSVLIAATDFVGQVCPRLIWRESIPTTVDQGP